MRSELDRHRLNEMAIHGTALGQGGKHCAACAARGDWFDQPRCGALETSAGGARCWRDSDHPRDYHEGRHGERWPIANTVTHLARPPELVPYMERGITRATSERLTTYCGAALDRLGEDERAASPALVYATGVPADLCPMCDHNARRELGEDEVTHLLVWGGAVMADLERPLADALAEAHEVRGASIDLVSIDETAEVTDEQWDRIAERLAEGAEVYQRAMGHEPNTIAFGDGVPENVRRHVTQSGLYMELERVEPPTSLEQATQELAEACSALWENARATFLEPTVRKLSAFLTRRGQR